MNLTKREILVFGLVVLVVFLGGLLLLVWYSGLQSAGFGGLGPGMMGPRMMGGFNMFGWLLPCLIPLILLVLLIGGLGWLLATDSEPQQNANAAAEANCPNCSRPVQTNWQLCPHCGTSLQKEQTQ